MNLEGLTKSIIIIYNIEKQISINNSKKRKKFKEKENTRKPIKVNEV